MNGIDFPFKTAVLALLQTAALVGLTVYAAMLAPEQRLTRLGLSFVIGGAIGNLIDRVLLATCWTSSTSTGAAGTSGLSTWPTPPLTSASR